MQRKDKNKKWIRGKLLKSGVGGESIIFGTERGIGVLLEPTHRPPATYFSLTVTLWGWRWARYCTGPPSPGGRASSCVA
jgi:hypothetical protein